jgi:hypothetical protein
MAGRARLDEANITWTGNRGQATIRVYDKAELSKSLA